MINKAVAALKNAVIDKKPAFGRLNGSGTGADLSGLPGACGFHDMTVFAPISEVFTAAYEDIAESGVTCITRTGEHVILAVDLSREENAVTVIGKEYVFELIEFLEIECVSKADCGTVVTVTPDNIISVFDPYDTGVIRINEFADIGIVADHFDGFGIDIPVDTVFGEACVDTHVTSGVIATENACKAVFKGNDCRVEDTVGIREKISGDNGILGIAPANFIIAGRLVFPRNVRKVGTYNGRHDDTPLY